MNEITLIERLSINRFNFLDCILQSIPFVDVGGITSNKRELSLPEQKIKDYKRLIETLDAGYNEEVLGLYMVSPCGRVQVRNAMKRGLLTENQYSKLKNKYKINFVKCN